MSFALFTQILSREAWLMWLTKIFKRGHALHWSHPVSGLCCSLTQWILCLYEHWLLCRDNSPVRLHMLPGSGNVPTSCLVTVNLSLYCWLLKHNNKRSTPRCPLSQGGPVEILPFLYLGSALHASKKEVLDGIGISALLNVSADCPNHFEGVYQYKCIPVEDNHKEDISSWFLEAIEFIGQCVSVVYVCVGACVWHRGRKNSCVFRPRMFFFVIL